MLTWILGHVLALGIGLSLGLMGGGGSVLALPILVYVMGVSPESAIPMTLVIIGSISLLAVIPHWKAGNVDLRKGAIFGSATMVGAFLGARAATLPFVSDVFQMLLFGGLMFVGAILMIRRSASPGSPEQSDLKQYPPPVCPYCWLWLLTEGVGVGVLTGFVGVGGGFAIVPALTILGKVPMRQAIGTSLLIIVMNSVAGVLGYWGKVNWDLNIIITFIIAASSGTVLGASLSQKIRVYHLQKGFGYFLLAISALVLFQNRQVFYPFSSPESTRQGNINNLGKEGNK